MNTNQVITNYLESELCANNISLGDTDPLIEQGIIDSFGIMSLISFLEERFAIQISGDELIPENFNSISTISLLVNKKIGSLMEA